MCNRNGFPADGAAGIDDAACADAGSGPPTPEELWQSRWLLTWDGTPAEFIGV
ncbi:MAG TPA: hypothetical protein VMP01_29815 [Pirellulaceae bacterium]|nr:hypothetical protein [Pirellulaceae bacterium]